MRLFRPPLPAQWLYPEALFRIKSSGKAVYLSFDDGPDPGSTPELLETLRSQNIKAYFFCNGRAAEKYPSLIDEIRSAGHIIGNHGYSHLNGWETSTREYCDDVALASPFTSGKLFRPPFGRIKLSQYRELRKSYTIFFWDIMAYDFDESFSPDKSLAFLIRKIRPGSIIVLHDAPWSSCKYILKEFIEISFAREYRFELKYYI
jgi:peptidoglycan/xylan/chitin deacetylase (PgdA/CDA1 family)